MGKPIQKKYFGLASLPGKQIVVNGVKFADGTTATSAYIVKQTGSNAYVVQDTAKSHAPEIVFMVNAASVGALLPGQCFITATPFGGTARPCKKIAQYRVDLFEADGTVDSYSWSNFPATAAGQANLISGSGSVGAILSVAVNNGGRGYFTAPTVTFTGGGSGAVATATIANSIVTGFTVSSNGTGYSSGGVTLSAPPASVTALASGTATGGAVDSVVVVSNGGGYYSVAPAVTITGGNGDATASAVLTNGAVTSIVVNTAGTGYTTPVEFTIAAPPAAVQATATATISS